MTLIEKEIKNNARLKPKSVDEVALIFACPNPEKMRWFVFGSYNGAQCCGCAGSCSITGQDLFQKPEEQMTLFDRHPARSAGGGDQSWTFTFYR